MESPPTLAEMVRNGTMSAEMAATLWAAADGQHSFLTVALPRFAGKTTLSDAVLTMRPPEVPLHYVDGSPEMMARLSRERLGGYLVVPEFSQAPVPGYIWGEPVRRVFETLAAGYSLQASLHAPSATEAVRIVAEDNGVGDEQASAIDLVVYIERRGDEASGYQRRLAEVYELDEVRDGKPSGRTLFRWLQAEDRFETKEQPQHSTGDGSDIQERTAVLAELARQRLTSDADVAAAVAAYRGRR